MSLPAKALQHMHCDAPYTPEEVAELIHVDVSTAKAVLRELVRGGSER